MRILVTGAVGFIGSHVVEAFAADGHAVTGLDVLVPSVPASEPGTGDAAAPSERPASGSDDRLIRADVRDADAVAAVLSGVDLVCHQAAMVGLGAGFADAPDYVSRNDLGTAVLLAEMARAGVRRLVLASSMVIYGEGRYECPLHGQRRPGPRLVTDLEAGRFEPGCPDCGVPLLTGLVGEDAPADPRNVYAATKLMQEHLAASWARVTGGTVAALRYHNVYGPRMPVDTPYAGVAAIFRSALARGHAPQVFEDGGQLRDFVHVRDVAQANAVAARWAADAAPRTFRAFNVGSGSPHSVGELAAELSRVLAGPWPEVTGEYRLGDVRHIIASSERIRTELDWRPRVSFSGGLAEFADLTRLAQAT
jgi:dTDP-L-rhamnose 4-epimerase